MASARVPGFTPSVNGLHFVNAFPHEPAVVVDAPPLGRIAIGDASNGLCGGMVFTVCDVFATPGMAPVPDVDPPAADAPLFRYIVARLIDSFDLPHAGFMKYYEWMVTPDGDTAWPPFFVRRGLAWRTIVDEWAGRIRPQLDAGGLCPLGLVTVASADPSDLGRNHQVLAYGYDLDDAGALQLLVYDPNTARERADGVRIAFHVSEPSQATPISHNVAIGGPIRGLFAVPYRWRDPTGLEPAARLSLAAVGPRGAAGVPDGVLEAGRLRIAVTPARVRAGRAARVTVRAFDAASGRPVAGVVRLGGVEVGPTGRPFEYTFLGSPAAGGGRRTSHGGRGGPALGTVVAPGYVPALVEFDLR